MKRVSKLILFILFFTIIVYCGLIIVISDQKILAVSQENEIETQTSTIEPVLTINMYGKTIPYNIKNLDLSKAKIDDSLIIKLSQFPNLKKVNLKKQKLDTKKQCALEKAFPKVKFIWDVKVLNKKVDSNIKKLNLKNCKVKDIKSFKRSLSLLHKLKYLDMSDCNLSNKKLAKLRKAFPKTKIVWRLYLGKWSLKTDDVAFSVLVTRFNYRRMTSSDIEVLKYCTDLKALDLGHQSITDISVIGKYLKDLRVLILADNRISDIRPLKKLKHLHYLELFMNRVRDISPLKSCKELVDLNLAHIPTLYNFSPLISKKFKYLERLCIQNSGGTYRYYSAIRRKYPKAKIVYYGYGSTHSGWRTHKRYYAMINMFRERDYISKLFTMYDK